MIFVFSIFCLIVLLFVFLLIVRLVIDYCWKDPRRFNKLIKRTYTLGGPPLATLIFPTLVNAFKVWSTKVVHLTWIILLFLSPILLAGIIFMIHENRPKTSDLGKEAGVLSARGRPFKKVERWLLALILIGFIAIVLYGVTAALGTYIGYLQFYCESSSRSASD